MNLTPTLFSLIAAQLTRRAGRTRAQGRRLTRRRRHPTTAKALRRRFFRRHNQQRYRRALRRLTDKH